MSDDAARPREPSPRARELFHALSALRAATHPAGPENAPHWAVVDRYVRAVVRVHGPEADDDRQDVLLAIVAHAPAMRAETPVSAAAWVRTICHRVRVDRFRGRARKRHISIDDPDRPIHLVAPEPTQRDLLDDVLADIEARLLARPGAPEGRERTRRLRTLQARAAIRRLVLGENTGAIARALGRPASADLISKWVERGRGVLIGAISRLTASEPDAAELYAPLVDLATRRRADHGVPRPARRRSWTAN